MARLSNVFNYVIGVHFHWYLFWFYAKNQIDRIRVFGGRQKYAIISDFVIVDCKVFSKIVQQLEKKLIFFFLFVIFTLIQFYIGHHITGTTDRSLLIWYTIFVCNWWCRVDGHCRE